MILLLNNRDADLISHLQSLQEAKGTEAPSTGYQTERGVVQHLSVVIPAGRQKEKINHRIN